jgi:hypothetical protein
VGNNEHHGAERQEPRHQEGDSSYSDFLATHPLVFADATDPLQADATDPLATHPFYRWRSYVVYQDDWIIGIIGDQVGQLGENEEYWIGRLRVVWIVNSELQVGSPRLC